ncbi:MAG: mandelate racemase/muconate lactonizing enzyme family protein [Myxococcota bacterium]
MSLLHAQIEVVGGELDQALVGAPEGIRERVFVVLTLTDAEGVSGVGEASPLPGYSPDSVEEAVETLRELVEAPIEVDADLSARQMLDQTAEVQLATSPAARFAIETAILDWLGQARGRPLHRLLSADGSRPVEIAALVFEPDPSSWPVAADALVANGRKHLKFKIGAGSLVDEVHALEAVRRAHPSASIRVDANRRLPFAELAQHRDALLALDLAFIEEPVDPASWLEAGSLGLPLALDETLREEAASRLMLPNPNLRALVIKPSVVGGITAALDLAKIGRDYGAEPVISHVFEGPIARAACGEIALAVEATLPQGLGDHPCLELWPDHRLAGFAGTTLSPHAASGLGLTFEEVNDA